MADGQGQSSPNSENPCNLKFENLKSPQHQDPKRTFGILQTLDAMPSSIPKTNIPESETLNTSIPDSLTPRIPC